MRDYQAKKSPFALPDTLYRRVLVLIRDYPRMKDEYQEVLHGGEGASVLELGGERRRNTSRTERKAVKLAALSGDMKAVEQAIILIPDEYRTAVLDNVLYHAPYPLFADRSTYARWKQRFVFNVAWNLGYV